MLNYMCGVEMANTKEEQFVPPPQIEKITPEEEAELAAESLWEPDWKKILVDANAVLLMSVAMFFWGFYA